MAAVTVEPPPDPEASPSPPSNGDDPVRRQRARVARLVTVGQRIGYSLFGVAVVAFAIGFVVGFDHAIVLGIELCLLLGSLVLAPSIVLAYAVKAAERDDLEHGR
jgi:hypothetical protein